MLFPIPKCPPPPLFPNATENERRAHQLRLARYRKDVKADQRWMTIGLWFTFAPPIVALIVSIGFFIHFVN